jgi:NADPH:quinone reductase-like Zn-dependent oxidoreductase
MKAAVYRRYGPPSVIQIADVPRPEIKTTEILVKVRATTISAGDSRLRSARVPRGFAVLMRLGFGIVGPRKPILGMELAGEVVAVGQSVSRFAPGDKARIQPGERVLINGASGAVGSAAVQLAKHSGRK